MFWKARFSLFRGCSLGGCTRNGGCSMPMTSPSFAGTLLTMTQAIGMDQVGRLETIRGARRGERYTLPSSQRPSSQRSCKHLRRRMSVPCSAARAADGERGFGCSRPSQPPRLLSAKSPSTGCDGLHRKSAMRRKRASRSACYSSVQIICFGRVRIEPDRPCSADFGVDEDAAGARW